MKRIFLPFLLFFVIVYNAGYAQVAINTTGDDAKSSAMLDVSSTTKGVLIPRMTATERDAIASPEQGLMVFVTTDSAFYFYEGTSWQKVGNGSSGWMQRGNNIYTDSLHHIVIGKSSSDAKFEVATVQYDGTYSGGDECSGGTASASSTYGSYSASNAFDDDLGTYWLNDDVLPVYLEYDFGSGNEKRISRYGINFNEPSSTDHSPADWQFQYSDDGSTWTDLDVQSGVNWAASGWKTFDFSNTTAHRYYRLYITDNKSTSDKYVQINEMTMLQEDMSNHPTLYVYDNKVGVGTDDPQSTLHVSGTMRFEDGNESSGKVLVSDASGNASWTDGATVNGGSWTISGDTAYNSGKRVGIDNSSPDAELDVNGNIKLSNGTSSSNPVAGMIRWNSTEEDFEGYNGTTWMSLTKIYSGWGGNNSVDESSVYIASDGSSSDYYGHSVSLDGDYAIVGAYYKDVSGVSNQGGAYILHRSYSAWSEDDIITASDGAANDFFGCSVSISGDYAIIGAHGKNSSKGKAYIFYNSSSWSQQAGLTASDGASYDNFGVSVAIDGDYAIVGSSGADISGSLQQGKAYIYYRSGTSWTEQDILTASDGTSGDYFGSRVSISGDYAIVTGGNTSKVYVFYRSGTSWSEQTILTASDGSSGDSFGTSIYIDGDYVIIGASGADVSGNSNQGKAYVFHRSGTSWTEEAILTSSDGAENDYFGLSVCINGDYAIIGAYNKSIPGHSFQGKSYVFHRSGTSWFEEAGLAASDGDDSDQFGISVSISGDCVLVGADQKDVSGNADQGKVYFYKHY